MEMALLNEVEATDVGITARLERGTDGSGVTLRITLDPAKVSLKAQLGGWAGKVEEEFVELNESGRTLAKISDKKEFEVTADQRAQYDREGVTWPFAVPLQPGATKIGIVVRDSATGRLGSLTIPLQ
jgi:hypothetical protein